MSKSDIFKMEGKVIETFPSTRFLVELVNGHKLTCIICGKIRKNNIKIIMHDRVEVEMSPYDLSLGRIVYRF